GARAELDSASIACGNRPCSQALPHGPDTRSSRLEKRAPCGWLALGRPRWRRCCRCCWRLALGVRPGFRQGWSLCWAWNSAAWLVEPALIGVVATVILIRARLRSVGGDLDERATRVEWAALSLSIALNCVGHWPDSLGVTAFAALVGHALGPLGAAGTAYLISVIQDGISSADPWHLGDGSPAPSLMGAEEVATGTEPEQSTGVGDRTSFTWPVELPSGARLLPIVAAPEPPGEASVNLTENAQATSP